jgi:hypothetical protein
MIATKLTIIDARSLFLRKDGESLFGEQVRHNAAPRTGTHNAEVVRLTVPNVDRMHCTSARNSFDEK